MLVPFSADLRPAVARVRSVSVEVLVVLAGVVTYFGIRGLTAGSPETAQDHARDIVALQERLHLDHEAWVQQHVVGSDAASTFFNWIYIWGHWPVIVATLVWLALRHRTIYLRLRNGMMASGGLGLLVYTTYPVAPPRLAELGLVDTVTERSSAYRVLQPPAFVNQYAAMPSLHVGWDLLVGLALISAGALWLRVLGRLMPLFMALATVATANHYLLDVFAGIAFALAGHAIALHVERRREARALSPPGRAADGAAAAGATAADGAAAAGATAAGPAAAAGATATAGPAAVPAPRRAPDAVGSSGGSDRPATDTGSSDADVAGSRVSDSCGRP